MFLKKMQKKKCIYIIYLYIYNTYINTVNKKKKENNKFKTCNNNG